MLLSSECYNLVYLTVKHLKILKLLRKITVALCSRCVLLNNQQLLSLSLTLSLTLSLSFLSNRSCNLQPLRRCPFKRSIGNDFTKTILSSFRFSRQKFNRLRWLWRCQLDLNDPTTGCPIGLFPACVLRNRSRPNLSQPVQRKGVQLVWSQWPLTQFPQSIMENQFCQLQPLK